MHQLRITAGPGAGRVLALNPAYSYTLGRDAGAHLSVPEDQTLSRTHAEFVPQGGGWLLRNKSQHGSLVNGQVVHGDQPIPVGATFQIGAVTVVLEAQGAAAATGAPPVPGAGDPTAPTVPPPMPGAAQPQPAGGGAPAGGGGAGFDGAKAADDAGKALAAGGAALGAAAASLAEGAGPVSINHEGPGYPFGDLVKGGLAIVKGNLVPSLAVFAPYMLVIILSVVSGFLPAAVAGIIALVVGILALIFMFVMPQVVCNYIAAVKEFQATGRSISIGDLLKFNDIVPRYITMFIIGLSAICIYIPPMILCMAIPLIIDRPEVGFMNAIKAALAFGKRNLVPNILLCIVAGIVNTIGFIACGVGGLVTMPLVMCYFWLAYALKKDEINAAAAEDGIELT